MASWIDNMEILKREGLWEGNFLRTLLITYRDKRGKTRKWEAVERIRCKTVAAVVPLTRAGEFILVRQYRPVVENFVIEFPAGLTPPDEDPKDTAYRELIEETGYVSTDIHFLAQGPISSGMSTEDIVFYLANDAVLADEALREQFPPDDSEDIEVIVIPSEGIYEVLSERGSKGDLIDIKVYGLIELSRRYLHELHAKNQFTSQRRL